MTPLVCEIAYLEPVAALGLLPPKPGLVFLDSAMPHERLGRWAWIGVNPFGRFTCRDGEAFYDGVQIDAPPIAALRGLMRRFAQRPTPVPSHFSGGASGYFTYEAGRLFERLPPPKRRDGRPEIDLFFHDVGLAFDVVARRAFVVSTGLPVEEAARRRVRAAERADWLMDLLSLHNPDEAKRRPSDLAPPRIPLRSMRATTGPMGIPRHAWRADMDAGEYRRAVERVRAYVAAGDIFQANLTQTFRANLPEAFEPVSLYRQLRKANPAPFSALVVSPERIIASTSPEGFLSLRGGEVETRPIKGTRRRSADEHEDRRLAAELLASEKDRAENVMIVDLMRNDLSRVCSAGTVVAPILCGLESYASVHHLVSVVRGRLKPQHDALDLLAACFPGGSITGAPKIRAMEIIHALEAAPRGVYCGSVVHLGFDGTLASSIAIRTLVVEDGIASIGAGGGITLLSDPDEEYSEMRLKAERMLAAFAPPIAERAAS